MLTVTHGYPIDSVSLDTMATWISERIVAGKKPAVLLQKQLNRIELHKEQLTDAYQKLFDCYVVNSVPQTRQSATERARFEMLSSMQDKMLREFCATYLHGAEQDYVLPDEREQLITATITAM